MTSKTSTPPICGRFAASLKPRTLLIVTPMPPTVTVIPPTPSKPSALVAKIEELAQAVARVTEFGFPLDLNLARTNVRSLLYEVLLRFRDDLSTRGISLELGVAPEV